ncbi:MAG: tetratricopeptide repeat protein [Candidatus Obscuribacterales bacterium]
MDTITKKPHSDYPPIVRNLDEGRQLSIVIRVAGETFTLEPYLVSPQLAAHQVSTRLIGCPSSGKLEELQQSRRFLLQARFSATTNGVIVSPKLLGGLSVEEATKQLTNACQKGEDEKAIKLLKEHSLPKDLKDDQGNPLICWMAQNEMVATLTCALDEGWNPNLPNTSGIYPLHYAAVKSAALTEALLKVFANPFVQTPKGNTPGGLAKSNGNVEFLNALILFIGSTPFFDYMSFEKSYEDLKSRINQLDLNGQLALVESAFLLGDREVLAHLYTNGSWSELMHHLTQVYPFAKREIAGFVNALSSLSNTPITDAITGGSFSSSHSMVGLSSEEILSYGVTLFDGGKFSDALPFFLKCLELQASKNNVGKWMEVCSRVGNTYYGLGEYRKAIEYHGKYLEVAIKKNNLSAKGTAYNNIGMAYKGLGDYKKALNYHEKCLEIALKLDSPTQVGKAYGNLGNDYYGLKEYEKAINCHEKDLQTARQHGDLVGIGRACWSLGNAYDKLGDYHKAIKYNEEYLQIAQKLGDVVGKRTAYEGLGNAHNRLREYRKAIKYYEELLQLSSKLGDPASMRAACAELGLAYFSLGEYRKAIEYCEQALQISLKLKDTVGELITHGCLGNAYYNLREYRSAIKHYEKCLKLAQKLRYPDSGMLPYIYLGNAYERLGEHKKAIEYHEKDLTTGVTLNDPTREGMAYGNLGITYQSLGEHRKAIECQENSLKIFVGIDDPSGQMRAYSNLGAPYYSLAEYQKAFESYKKALELALKLNDLQTQGVAHTGLGAICWLLGDGQQAIQRHELALKIFLEANNMAQASQACGQLGNAYYLLRGDYPQAIRYHKQSLQIARKLGDPAMEGRAYGNLAAVYLFGLKDPSACEEAAWQAIRAHSAMKRSLGEDSWKITIFEEHSKAYFLLLKALISQGKEAEALSAADFGRSRALSDLLSVRAKHASSALSISTLGAQKIDHPLSPDVDLSYPSQKIIESSVPRLVTSSLEHMLAEKDLIQVAQNLKTTAVVYFSDWEDTGVLHAWVVDAKQGISYKKLDVSCLPVGEQKDPVPFSDSNSLTHDFLDPERRSKQLRTAARYLVSELEEATRGSVNVGQGITRDLKLWYKALIAPLEGLLPTEEGSRLTFIPDASLGIVPFAALQKEDNSYLVEQYTISMAPSLGVLSKLAEIHSHKGSEAKPAKGCVVGDPQENLQSAKQEGLEVASALKTDPIMGKNASIDVIQKAISEARWIHFACHGDPSKRTDIHSVYEGALGLAPPKEDPKGGWWHANEIQKIPLSAELVFLSGCDTGKGKIQREGVIGLTRSFLAAGASCVIATQWPIADEATTKLVGSFYRSILNTRKPKKKAEALREMMLEGINRGMPPEKWAPFFLEGWPE